MAYLEQRVDGEALVQFGAQARECLVGEEDIALDLLRYLINCAGVAEAKRLPSRLNGSICVEHGIQEAVRTQWRECLRDCLRYCSDVDGHCRLF